MNGKTLIFGTSYIKDAGRAHLLQLWARVNLHLNPDCDLLIVDSASPLPLFDGDPFLADTFDTVAVDGDFSPAQVGPRAVVVFPDNIGHLLTGDGDGWGRALTLGIEIGLAKSYDYIVHIEADLLFLITVGSVISHMRSRGWSVCSTIDPATRMFETGIMFFSAEWIRRTSLLTRYDWRERRQFDIPEDIIAEICGDDLAIRPWQGCRNDCATVTRDNMRKRPLKWLTHCDDVDLYDEMLRFNGLEALLAPAPR